ncbi:RNA polymerase II transcriptional coactivator SUB1 OS=Saccharomyces cerevisiae (strain ATCC 204508 / S288c) GN=SUB1 PE=1 SV=1 [Rhizoctonia solani AG-1 IB]|uniref:RNA polymerase II transcriptional coactivator SUB1 n=1 Tax=Thanatephorus cucumeris (strain AG1-IB / isolate 7/3/14) TaxID=1108050 RepID=A0A0B7F893_THACB|nr:RNA polymerase II transcriptional coactivator SUB1 OS=Saccharomyces cerevisiae (strain ATCC 204508 / S288c) GN=SUB1 PE=1 SV=1 [Rhizoctonia solani AG-1 IB]
MPSKRTRKDESEGESSAEETPVLVKKPASGTVTVPVPDKQINAEGDTYFEISGKRRVTVRSFNGLKLVDIREMYTDKASGELKPGKKGISLSEEQFMGLVNVHEGISQALNELDVGGSSKITKPTKVAKTTRTKASSSKEPKDAKPASKPKPTSKKKARKVESDEEDEDED